MRKIFLASLATMAALGGLNANAAQSAELRLAGQIVTGACQIQLSSADNTIDYGTIFASTLKADAWTNVDGKSIGFRIDCEQPSLIALRGTDSRGGAIMPPSRRENIYYSMGTDSAGSQIGSYGFVILPGNLQADGVSATPIANDAEGSGSWAAHIEFFKPEGDRLISFSKSPNLGTPAAVTMVTGSFATSADSAIRPKNDLALHEEVLIDGMATVELVYL